MSFTIRSVGDNYHRGSNLVTKVADAGYTTPAVGDLVALGTTTGNSVVGPGDEVLPYGIVESVNNTNGYLTVAEFVQGCTIELPYSSTVSLGDAVEITSATQGTLVLRSTIGTENTAGVGNIIAKDADSPHGTGYCVVRF